MHYQEKNNKYKCGFRMFLIISTQLTVSLFFVLLLFKLDPYTLFSITPQLKSSGSSIAKILSNLILNFAQADLQYASDGALIKLSSNSAMDNLPESSGRSGFTNLATGHNPGSETGTAGPVNPGLDIASENYPNFQDPRYPGSPHKWLSATQYDAKARYHSYFIRVKFVRLDYLERERIGLMHNLQNAWSPLEHNMYAD